MAFKRSGVRFSYAPQKVADSAAFIVLRRNLRINLGEGPQITPLYVRRERRGPSALPEHDYFDFREQIPAFLLPAIHRSRPAPRVPKSVPLEAKQGAKCFYQDKNQDAGSGSAPAKPFTRTGSGVSGTFPDSRAGSGNAPAKPFTRTGSGGSEAEPDSGAGAAAVPAAL